MTPLLCINLDDRSHRIEYPDSDILSSWIGGRGLAGYFLRPHVTLPWSDPSMPVILMAGPLAGTPAPASGRMCIMSRSPLTGTIGDCSVGGSLAFQLRRAGYMGVILTGRHGTPCGIEISDDTITFSDARELAGRGTGEIHSLLRDKGSVVATGPAAENGVLFSNIMVDGCHAAGRNGIGLVLASKNVKYITVKGSGKVPVCDRAGLKSAAEQIYRLVAASPVLLGEYGIRDMGTGALYDLMHSRRMMPTANFRKTLFKHAPSMNACALQKLYNTSRTGCRGCHIQCKKIGEHGVHMPEFETMSHFSALLENSDLPTVVTANSICNSMGMDTISAGVTLACFAEIREKRLSPDEITALLRDIALAAGDGKHLGVGSYRYARGEGCPEVSISVKKQELPAYDPRGAYGMALAYVTSTRGGCHLRAYPISHEILRKPVVTDRFSFAGKARIIKIAEDANAVIDSISACKFIFFGATLEEYAKACAAVTGTCTTAQDLLDSGERTVYNERIMNALNGFTAAEDDLPPRFFREEGSSGGGINVPPIDREEFLGALGRYYIVRGLDGNGLPTVDRSEQLGLMWPTEGERS